MLVALSSGAWGAIAAVGAAGCTGMFGLILHFLQKERTENALQHAANVAELKNVVVGLAEVKGAVNAHIASPHYLPTKEYAP